MTQLCTYCGSTYDVIHGHVCHPTIATTGTATMAAQHTYSPACDGLHPPGSCAAPNFAAGLSDDDIDRIAEAVVRKIRLARRAQGRVGSEFLAGI